MRLLFIIFSLFFINGFMAGCSETTDTGTIILTDTITAGHDERLAGLWSPVKYIRDGATTITSGNSTLLIDSNGGYSDNYNVTEERGSWETMMDSLTLKSGVNFPRIRKGPYKVTSATEFVYTYEGKTWYYQKK
ncbi:MAG TPA: hypothetical protein VHO70_00405 [Chitinispirillaceae bacterium]|nr:hypothetical protein [Chitinispirillaceae bacterium]